MPLVHVQRHDLLEQLVQRLVRVRHDQGSLLCTQGWLFMSALKRSDPRIQALIKFRIRTAGQTKVDQNSSQYEAEMVQI